MIIVKLMGGMGNQMFQYAAGRSLASLRSTGLRIDLSYMKNTPEGDTKRECMLHHLSLDLVEASPLEVAEMAGRPANLLQGLHIRLRRGAGFAGYAPNPLVEPHYHYWDGLMAAERDAYLDGFWQSYRYFENIRETIRREFTVRAEILPENARVADMIKGCESVSVHLRRGDFLKPGTIDFHGLCGEEYYRKALDLIYSKLGNPRFFIFTDAPESVEPVLGSDLHAETVLGNYPEKPWEDLRLMAMCRHHVIANSSFSWWGAWLGANPEKLVIAPDAWFARSDIDTRDLCPPEWIRV